MKKRSGATFSEVVMLLLIVALLAAVLAAIIFPIFASTHSPSRQTACMSHMKQISLAAQQYAQDYDGRLPDSCLSNAASPAVAWVTQLDPYTKNPAVYFCPTDLSDTKPAEPGKRFSSYSLNKWTTFGLKIADMKDPAAFVLIGERNNETQGPEAPYLFAGWNWQEHNGIAAPRKMARGQDIQAAKVLALQRHSGGAVWAFADGHAKWRKFQEICEEGMFRP